MNHWMKEFFPHEVMRSSVLKFSQAGTSKIVCEYKYHMSGHLQPGAGGVGDDDV